jgi:tripartite ATP-independent transporter DctM subunit
MDGLTATLLIFGSLLTLLLLGLPLAYCMGGIAIACSWFFWGPHSVYMFVGKMWDSVNNFTLVALPLFVLLAGLLQESGIAEELYGTMRKCMGGLKGGLAIGSVIISAIFAAMSGLSATATISLGVIAVPSMLKYGYDKKIISGCLQAGGALGILIPPSVMMIVYGMIAQTSVGKLFIGGILPGLLLVALFIIYIIIRCAINPSMGPPIPVEERVSAKEKLKSLKSVLPPIIVIIIVIGSITRVLRASQSPPRLELLLS